MKKIITSFIFIFVFISLFFINGKKTNAVTSHPLDEILKYEIRVKTNSDATLDLDYQIEWKVLDSSSEGPLEWVKIGVPNRFVSNIKNYESNVKKIEYSSDDGAFIEIHFNQKYYKNDVVKIHFSFHQSRIFTFNKNTNKVEFRFIPGWFTDISVKSLKVYWPKDGVIYNNSNSSDSDYYIWSFELNQNEKINVDLNYEENYFVDKDLKKQYSSQTYNPIIVVVIIGVVGLFIIGVLCIIAVGNRNAGDGYYYYRGYYGTRLHRNYMFYHIFHHTGTNSRGEKTSLPPVTVNGGTSGSHSSGSSCACACACACAGGGRAGCSRKDFTTFEADTIIRKLEKENE